MKLGRNEDSKKFEIQIHWKLNPSCVCVCVCVCMEWGEQQLYDSLLSVICSRTSKIVTELILVYFLHFRILSCANLKFESTILDNLREVLCHTGTTMAWLRI